MLEEEKKSSSESDNTYYAQFFWDNGKGFNNNFTSQPLNIDLINRSNIFRYNFREGGRAIKFVLFNSYLITKIKKVIIFTSEEAIEIQNSIKTNALFKINNTYFFTNNNPYILYEDRKNIEKGGTVECSVDYLYFGENALLETINVLYYENLEKGKIDNEKIVPLRNVILEKDYEICELKKILLRTKEILLQVEPLSKEKEALEEEIVSYVTSRSWRYTRPFRKTFRKIKELLKNHKS